MTTSLPSIRCVQTLEMPPNGYKEQPDEELWIAIGGTLYKFTYVGFFRISGLPAGAEPVATAGDVSGQETSDEAEPVGAIAKKYLGGSVDITHVNLKNIFEKLKLSKRRDQLHAVKLASLFYIECVLLAKDNTTRINASSVRLVNDLEEFKKCPWSLRSYKLLVSHMKGLMDGQPQKFKDRKEKNPNYRNAKLSVYSFPLVLQVWAYEEINGVGKNFTNKVGNHDVPLLNWKAERKFHYSKLRRVVFPEEEEKLSDSEWGEEQENQEEEMTEEDLGLFEKVKIMEELQDLRKYVERVENKITSVEESLSEIKVLLVKLIGKPNPLVEERLIRMRLGMNK
ncbi:unnamed protein product [Cuscuta europaea]|uniref:DUF1985 domain-containing protein n=1 Tax=Cuscuta europaea TaxID=41803 RepID=A0A9P0YHR2_CUSEU|nr:unnamed protein product [Cuscuta europaea]